MKRLQGKYIVITGASQGLGRELAIRYAREGAAGLSLTARNADAPNEVRERIREISPDTRVVTTAADLSRQEEIERVIATALDAFAGRIDVLVNNASALGPTPMP
ncbi:MAG TPA: SDR family NAD(P)-dependent oxidoreductase, partial [Blastocatellia bacterium]|nr:SDR family NAD(P)-dependent oxidoreductase [Blastocatellia bacterium]